VPEVDAIAGHFIRFVGWLREDGVFTLDRGWETPKITEPPRGCRDYRLELLDRRQVILESVVPQVKASDCRSLEGRMKTFRVLAYMPWHADGATIRFRKGDRIIDEIRVDSEPPSVRNAVARVANDMLHVTWEAAHDEPLLYKVAIIQARRKFTIVDRATETSVTIPIAGIPLDGECQAVVLATDKLRSATMRSPVFVLPPKSPPVHIVRPHNGETFSEGTGLSLVGHAIALDGRTLNDESLEWRVDGVGITEGKRVAWIDSLEAGTHRIQLSWRQDPQAVETIEIFVRPRSEQDLTWLRDLARFREATSNPNQ
jgi:hypothetical protein